MVVLGLFALGPIVMAVFGAKWLWEAVRLQKQQSGARAAILGILGIAVLLAGIVAACFIYPGIVFALNFPSPG